MSGLSINHALLPDMLYGIGHKGAQQMKNSAFLAIFGAALIAAAPSARAQSVPPPDTMAIVDDQAVADVLNATSNAKEIDEASARKFGPMLFRDGTLSGHERDLLQELLAPEGDKVTIMPPSGESFSVPPLSRQARGFLSLVQPPDLSLLWPRGPAQMKQLVDVTVLDPVITRRITAYIQARLATLWMNSTLSEGFKPFRDAISIAVRQLQQTDPDTERAGRALVYEAARDLDRANGDAIPNYLYDYLRN